MNTPEEEEIIDRAFNLLAETINLNTGFLAHQWASALACCLAHAFVQSGVGHEEFCKLIDRAKERYEYLFEK